MSPRTPSDPNLAARWLAWRQALLWLGLALIFVLDLALPLGVTASALYVLIVLASLSLRQVNWTVALAVVATVLTLVDVAVSAPGDTSLWVVRSNRVFSVIAIWTTVGIGIGLLREKVVRQATERSLDETAWRLRVHEEAEVESRRANAELEHRVAERTHDLVQSQRGLQEQIARRVESEERAVRSERVLRSIFDTASEAIITIDTRGTIESVNRAAERMFGWTAAELVGRNVKILMPAPWSSQHDDFILRYLGTGSARVIGVGREVVGRRKDGESFPLDLSVGEVVAEDGRKFTGILRDLTERKRLEEQFRQAQKMEAVGRLASGIAHDFNNLLAGVIGCAKLACKSLPSEHPSRELVEEIRGAAERGAALSRQLLNFSRQRPSESEPLDLNDVVRGASNMIRQVLDGACELELDLAPAGATLLGDQGKFEQILMNLAINARDAMSGGGVLRIRTEQLDASDPTRPPLLAHGRAVRLSVSDTGCGIDAQMRDRIFEPFFTTKPVGQGTGLGLYTVYALVEQLGGTIDFESEVGVGTTFRACFLHYEGAPRAAQVPAPTPAPKPADGSRGVVLLVEDERLIRVSLAHLLAGVGFEVLTAASVAEAQSASAERKGPIDLLITDMALPDGDGGELAERLRRQRPELRVLHMSAYPAESLIRQGRLPADAITLEKPFTEESLEAALDTVLRARAPAQGVG